MTDLCKKAKNERERVPCVYEGGVRIKKRRWRVHYVWLVVLAAFVFEIDNCSGGSS